MPDAKIAESDDVKVIARNSTEVSLHQLTAASNQPLDR
jgi:hypothetical protein